MIEESPKLLGGSFDSIVNVTLKNVKTRFFDRILIMIL